MLSINFAKYMQDLYAENYEPLIKEIKENLDEGSNVQMGGLNIVKISVLPKLTGRLNVILIKIPADFL